MINVFGKKKYFVDKVDFVNDLNNSIENFYCIFILGHVSLSKQLIIEIFDGLNVGNIVVGAILVNYIKAFSLIFLGEVADREIIEFIQFFTSVRMVFENFKHEFAILFA